MSRISAASSPGSGSIAGRPSCAVRGLIAAALIADMLTMPTHARHQPRIAYPEIAPNTFVMNGDATQALTAEQARTAAAQLALSQLSQNYRPNPAIWKIADSDTTIYLFGTIHVLPPGFQWRTAALERIVARADALLIESVDDGADVDRLIAGRGAVRSMRRLPPLAARISRDHRDRLARLMAGLPPQAATLLDTMPTWIAAIAVSFARELHAGEIPGPGADDWIEQRFRARQKPVIPIEDGSKVLASVNAIAAADQRRMLEAALDAPDRTRAELRAPLHAWAKGDIGPDSVLTIDLAASTGSSALTGPLLEDRNRDWARALIERLKTPGIVLFAAGAGHFIGNGSVIDRLERHGIEVARVQ